ncbi:MAG: MBL fold metallo-hydrolase [Candidatus Poseidoniaceae archaeon]|jgi:ribonuclease BN (tRNA processing enzyme)|tara:strand:- start:362 stop:1156 length:795 start_codon:yes stop_codon:yes gene_type:complete
MAQEVVMLGTGNAFMPYGRYHSFAMIDGKHVVDCPPTAMASFRRAGVPLSDIETIFITHVHGDHVFGFPFFLLERRYISDRAMVKPLTVVAAPGVKDRLKHLCQLAYPGSLEEIFATVQWREELEGELDCGLSWRRFVVHHDESVDPYGFHFNPGTEGSFVHSGDSGPCKVLYDEIAQASMVILEMGFPEYVDSDHHHKPSDVQAIAASLPAVQFVITHTYIDTPGVHPQPTVTDVYPVHPANVTHAEDELRISHDGKRWMVGA